MKAGKTQNPQIPGEGDINIVADHSAIRNPHSAINTPPLLSILTPAVPSRMASLQWLMAKLDRQIGDKPVEHLILIDNKRRTVGEKRDALLRAAKGRYVAFVDDDDDISDDYVEELVAAIERHRPIESSDALSCQAPITSSQWPDVITFLQKATVNGITGIIEFKLGNTNEPFKAFVETAASWSDYNPMVKRNAWHICAWRRELAIGSAFPPINYGEDWAFAAPLCAIAETSVHIDKILHFYRHDSSKTEAPPPSATPEPTYRPPLFGDAGPLAHNFTRPKSWN